MATKYTKNLVNPKKTPQNTPVPGKNQVVNNAGGYVFQIDKWSILDRFLILGSESPTYYSSSRDLTQDNIKSMDACLAENGKRVVDKIVEISQEGRAPRNDSAIFALAYALKSGNLETRRYAAENVSKVCRIGTHLFQFVDTLQYFGGWGRVTKRAVQNWYRDMNDGRLAYQLIKYQNRHGWTHRDVLRKAHVKPQSEIRDEMYAYAVKGWENVGDLPHDKEELRQIWAFEKAKNSENKKEVINLVETYNLPRECVPTQFLNDVDVQMALLQRMPMTAMIRNLSNMTRSGLLTNQSKATKMVIARLKNKEVIQKARIHPISVLIAMKTYASGGGYRSSNTWNPVPKIINALDKAFYLSFKNVEATGKRILIALDVSGSMGTQIMGMNLSCREASVAMAMSLMASGDDVDVVGFTSSRDSGYYNYGRTSLTDLDVSPRLRLDTNVSKVSGLRFGATDCAQPMLWANKKGYDYDAIIVFTDSETWHGDIHPFQALKDYRKDRNLDTKLVVCGMTATKFSIADPSDAGMLDIVGLDSSVPQLVSGFFADKF